jgi:hypothetical protein
MSQVMTYKLIAAGLLGALTLVSFAAGAEFGDPVRSGLRRLGRILMPSIGIHVVPAREVAESARRTPGRVENGQAAGAAPVISETGAVRTSQNVPAHPRFGPLLDTPPEGIETVRPVNGRSLGTQPRRTPTERGPVLPPRKPRQPWPTMPQAAVPDPWNGNHPGWDPGDGIDPPVALVRPYLPEQPDVIA